MITKSKIKTFNNTRKYIKKNKISGGGLLPGTDKKAAIAVQHLINTINNGQETDNFITFDTNENVWSGIFNDNLQALIEEWKSMLSLSTFYILYFYILIAILFAVVLILAYLL